jgi:STE24 endopeptidase
VAPTTRSAEDTQRRLALAVVAIGLVSFVVLAWWRVPWSPAGSPAPAPVSASSVFSQAQIDRAEGFATWARVWSWGALAASLALGWWLALGARPRKVYARLPGPWGVRVLLAVLLVQGVVTVLLLPLDAAQHEHARRNGLSNQAWSGFLRDEVVSWLIGVVVSALLAWLVVGCARRWRAWVVGVAAVAGGLVLLGSYGYPLVVEPLFNSFHSLPNGPLRTQVMALADREGVHVDDVLVADASRRTTTLNAYVSGFGDTRRVVLYDNLVKDEPPGQVLSVVAHELGHAQEDDVLTGSILGVAGAVLGVGLLGLVLGGGRRRGWPEAGDPRVVPLLLALVATASLLGAPVEDGISRKIETRADVIALAATDDPSSFVALQKELALRSLADPTPPAWSQWWFGTHPTVLQRIALASAIDK